MWHTGLLMLLFKGGGAEEDSPLHSRTNTLNWQRFEVLYLSNSRMHILNVFTPEDGCINMHHRHFCPCDVRYIIGP